MESGLGFIPPFKIIDKKLITHGNLTETSTIIEEYESKGEIIGTGTFANVCVGADSKNNMVAIKVIKPEWTKNAPPKIAELLMNEMILKGISHNNIVKLFAVGEHLILKTSCFVLEYCTEGSLENILRNKKLSEDEATFYFIQIGAGLKYLHDNNFIHRDLKPENILLTKINNKIVVKIADFGIARPLGVNELAQTMCGSRFYMAPEILLGGYTKKIDIWSCGVILFRMLTGDFVSPVIQIQVNEIEELKPFSNGCRLLLSKMLQIKPENRISSDELVNDPFLDVFKHIKDLPQMKTFYFNQIEEPECGTGKIYSWITIKRTKYFGIQDWGYLKHDRRVVVFVNDLNVIQIADGKHRHVERLLENLKIIEERENFELSELLNFLKTKNLKDVWEEYLKKLK